jgi:hypothetical protein
MKTRAGNCVFARRTTVAASTRARAAFGFSGRSGKLRQDRAAYVLRRRLHTRVVGRALTVFIRFFVCEL